VTTSLLRRLVLLSAAAAVVVGASGCNAGRPAAATVEGHDVPAAVVDDMLEALTSVEPRFRGQGEGTFGLQGATTVLTYLVDRELVFAAVGDRGVKISAQDRTAGKTNLLSQLGQDEKKAQQVFGRLDPSTRDHLVEREAAQIALQGDLGKGADAEGRARQAYDANPDQFAAACLSALTVEDDAAAAAARERIEGGEDFAAVAAEVSIDDQAANGGDIGCISLQQINDPQVAKLIADAEDRSLVGPFGQPGQMVLVQVREHRQQTFDEVKDQLVAQLPPAGQAELTEAISRLKARAHISVNPRYGRWNAKQGIVVPPAGPRGIASTTAPVGPAPAGAP